ncbi:ABC transporter permease [bacterium 1XD21-13]|nr:ABC transporter permease [bacterium 1XD21-13]
MKQLLWAERKKLHHSKIVWIAAFSVIMTAIIVFAQGQFTFNGLRYVDGAGWFMTATQSLATFYVLPAIVALLGSYMICREEQEDTMKSLRLVPIDEAKLTVAKMIVAMIFSVLIYLMLFMITFVAEAVMHFRMLSVQMVFGFLYTYFVNGVGIFLAISPIIALVARMKRGYWLALVFAEIYSFAALFASMSETLKTVYPITAVFQLSGYYEATIGNKVVSLVILIVCMALAALILTGLTHSNKRYIH